MEVPTIYKAYFSGLNFRGYSPKIWPKIWYSTSVKMDPGDLPLTRVMKKKTEKQKLS